MTEIIIPPEAIEAGARALASHYSYDWNENEELHAIWKEEAVTCIIKALNAWPEAERFVNQSPYDDGETWPHLILPLPTETTNAET